MALLCYDGCESVLDLPVNYQDFCAAPVRRKAGWSHFALIPCDENFDPKSAAAWCDVAAISPAGKVTFGTPTVNSSDEFSACGEEEILDTVITFDFQTVNMASDGADMKYFKDLLKGYKKFRIAFLSCDGRVTIAGDYTDAEQKTDFSPGYQFNITETPHEVEASNHTAAWRWQGEIAIGGAGMIEWDYVPGIEAALKGEECGGGGEGE